MKASLILRLLFLIPIGIIAQHDTLENEKVLFEFTTKNQQKLVIAEDVTDQYLVYRYGTSTEIELEFPKNKQDAWEVFTFSSYSRGGGEANEGMELNYLYFKIGVYTYVVFEEYLAKNSKTNYGIKVINTENNQTTLIKANSDSVTGTLNIFRDHQKIKKGDELFM